MKEFVKDDECIYSVFGVPRDASADAITKQYRKLALTFHPDRHAGKPVELLEEFKQKFQAMSYIYGILGNEARRARYDRTGSCSSAVADEIADFDQYFRNLYQSCVTPLTIEKFKQEYQGSEEERADVVESYKSHAGDMDLIMEDIPCSSVEDDENRFRTILEGAIAEGHLEAYEIFTAESTSKRETRHRNAAKEALEAAELSKELGVNGNGSIDDLKNAILGRQKRREENFNSYLDDMAVKYSGNDVEADTENATNELAVEEPAELAEPGVPIIAVAEANNTEPLATSEVETVVVPLENGEVVSTGDAVSAVVPEPATEAKTKTPAKSTHRSRSVALEIPSTALRRSSRQAAAQALKPSPEATPSKRRSSTLASAAKRPKKV